jgi:glycerol-3-phosphate dehydrogenase
MPTVRRLLNGSVPKRGCIPPRPDLSTFCSRRFMCPFKPLNMAVPSFQRPSKQSNILVFGAGSFGSCLADHLGDSDHHVFMWSRSRNIVEHFNKYRRNPEFLQDHEFSHHITAVGPEFPSEELLRKMDVLLFAIPTEGVRYGIYVQRSAAIYLLTTLGLCRTTLTALRPGLNLNKLPLLIFVNKGIEISTQSLTLEIVADVCGAKIARLATFIVSVAVRYYEFILTC